MVGKEGKGVMAYSSCASSWLRSCTGGLRGCGGLTDCCRCSSTVQKNVVVTRQNCLMKLSVHKKGAKILLGINSLEERLGARDGQFKSFQSTHGHEAHESAPGAICMERYHHPFPPSP